MDTNRPQGPEDIEVDGGRTRRLVIVGTVGVAARCRDFTRAALRDWGRLPARDSDRSAAVEDVLLLVSELVTNACVHAGGPTELMLRCGDGLLRMEVADRTTQAPVPEPMRRASRPGGHGLRIVSRLARDWGTAVRAADKSVWVEVCFPTTGALR